MRIIISLSRWYKMLWRNSEMVFERTTPLKSVYYIYMCIYIYIYAHISIGTCTVYLVFFVICFLLTYKGEKKKKPKLTKRNREN